jgi:glycosyltransferase involved in cell wall biosynthesis/CelD/BcsL family acetyltransferase involved in cellulose biosynthesis
VAYPFAPVGRDAVGGAEQVLAALDEAAVAAGHDSVVVALEGSRCAGRLIALPPPRAPIDEGVQRRARTAFAELVADASAAADVVHLHGVDFDRYLPPPGPPALVTLHLPLAWYPAGALRPRRPRTFLHCVSASQQRAFRGAAGLLEAIPNGVALERFRPRARRAGFALALGRVAPEKGFHLALAAARRAGVPMLLAGEVFPYPEHLRYFEREIAPLLDARRRFVGPVGLARKRRLLAAARCLVAPSLAAETSGLAAMEALASGTPVVAFAAGALAEIVEHGRTGLLARDAEELAGAIAAAAGLDGAACRQAAEERFDGRAMAARYLEVYRALAGSRTARTPTSSAAPAEPSQPRDRAPERDERARGSTPTATSTRFRRPSPALRVALVAPEDLARHEAAWISLWDRCRSATPFQRPEWLLPWYRHLAFGGGLALLAWRGAELVGLAPLHRFTEGGRRAVGLAGGPVSDYRDGLAADDRRDAVAAALRAGLPPLADVAILDDLPPDALLRWPGRPAERAQVCPELPLERGEPWSRASRRLLENLAYQRRRLRREHGATLEEAGAAGVPALLAVRERRFGAPGAAVEAFHREAAARLERAGLLRLHLLRAGGRVAAAALVLAARGRASLHALAHEPSLAARSPGAVLCAHAVERALAEGASAFDFLRGGERYKYAFGAADRITWRQRVEAPSRAAVTAGAPVPNV